MKGANRMISALVAASHGPGAPPLAEDLAAVGIHVLGQTNGATLLADVIRVTPDVVVIQDNHPDDALFDAVAALSRTAPCPVVLFTLDPDADKIARATQAGVHAYVVDGYRANRLRAVIHLAQARFRHDQALRAELAALQQTFAERKLVDRAKGILMGSRQLREDEAYRALRTAAMHSKQRIGQVAQQVIEAARYGEAVNRAGQLRMLSQRLVKLYALRCAASPPADTQATFADSLSQVDQTMAILTRTLSDATFGDLLAAVLTPWKALRSALAAPAQAARLTAVDSLAEDMLRHAEQLTLNLEVAGLAAALHVINVSGRQRMLCQRLAKAALIKALTQNDAAETMMEQARAELVEGLDYLANLTLSNAEIKRELAAAMTTWTAFDNAIAQQNQDKIAELSEHLLEQFDRLTDQLERGVQGLA
jgi:AmiR/NasT family two-component response regulator